MPRRPLYVERGEEWIATFSKRMKSPGTIDCLEGNLRQVWAFARENDWPSDPKKFQVEHVLSFYNDLKERLAYATQKLYMWTLLKFLRWAKNTHCSEIELRITPSRSSRIDWLTTRQVGELLVCSQTPYETAAVVIMAYTGARAMEVSELRCSDCNPNEITLRGKRNKERRVPVDAEFWAMLEPYMNYRAKLRPASNRFLVHEYRKKILEYKPETLFSLVTSVAKRARFHCSPHTLRRSFGRHLWQAGCPLETIRELLGHATVEMTIHYLGIDFADTQSAMTKFRPSYRSKMYPESIANGDVQK